MEALAGLLVGYRYIIHILNAYESRAESHLMNIYVLTVNVIIFTNIQEMNNDFLHDDVQWILLSQQ